MKKEASAPISRLGPFGQDGRTLNTIIEVPRGRRNKYKYDEERGLFELGGVLPVGAVFPFDFGFVPGTLGEDGDPLDVLVLLDEHCFPGCLVPARLLGAIKAEQTEEGKTERNDRLIAASAVGLGYKDVLNLHDLPVRLVEEIEHFFVSYNQQRGKTFRPRGRLDAAEAERLVREGAKGYEKGRGGR